MPPPLPRSRLASRTAEATFCGHLSPPVSTDPGTHPTSKSAAASTCPGGPDRAGPQLPWSGPQPPRSGPQPPGPDPTGAGRVRQPTRVAPLAGRSHVGPCAGARLRLEVQGLRALPLSASRSPCRPLPSFSEIIAYARLARRAPQPAWFGPPPRDDASRSPRPAPGARRRPHAPRPHAPRPHARRPAPARPAPGARDHGLDVVSASDWGQHPLTQSPAVRVRSAGARGVSDPHRPVSSRSGCCPQSKPRRHLAHDHRAPGAGRAGAGRRACGRGACGRGAAGGRRAPGAGRGDREASSARGGGPNHAVRRPTGEAGIGEISEKEGRPAGRPGC